MKIDSFQEVQIAPCGVNCMICMGYLKSNRNYPGCKNGNENKSNSCISCRIKNCNKLKDNNLIYCYECDQFPCKKMNHLDNRYKKNYNLSMIKNLVEIKNDGIEKFLLNEKERWICSDCGGIICVHRGYCSDCGKKYYFHSGTNRAQIKYHELIQLVNSIV